jgi:hypothetical protein
MQNRNLKHTLKSKEREQRSNAHMLLVASDTIIGTDF